MLFHLILLIAALTVGVTAGAASNVWWFGGKRKTLVGKSRIGQLLGNPKEGPVGLQIFRPLRNTCHLIGQ